MSWGQYVRLSLLLRIAWFQELVDRRGEPRSLVGCCGEGAVDVLVRDSGAQADWRVQYYERCLGRRYHLLEVSRMLDSHLERHDTR